MTTVGDVYNYIDSFAPFASQMGFDNAGLLIGSPDTAAGRIMVCLDATGDVIIEAAEKHCNLIVSHHPLIFSPLRRVPTDSHVYRMAALGLSLISAHTNLDLARGGVNDVLAGRLGLTDAAPCTPEQCGEADAIGVNGRLPSPMQPDEFASHVARSLGTTVSYTRGGRAVLRVAVVGGSGWDCIPGFIAAGFDAVVTSEIKHHILLEAVSAGITAVDAGHYGTEHPVVHPLAEKLRRQFPDAEIFEAGEPSPVLFVAP